MKKSKKIFFGIITIIVLVAIFSIIRKKHELSSFEKPTRYPLVVDASYIHKGELKSFQKFLGEFRPENDALVNAKFNSTVIYIANEGTKVKKGDIIFKLDSKDIESNISALSFSQKALQNQLESAKTQIEASTTQYINSKKNYERYKDLYSKNVISKVQLEDMENSYKQALANKQAALSKASELANNIKSISAQIDSLNDNLSYCEFKAPFDGIVANKFLNVGDTAIVGKPIIELVGSGRYLIYVTTPIDVALKLKRGDIETAYYNDKPMNAKVEDILQSSQNNLATVKLSVSKNPFNLPAHTYLDVYIYDGKCKGFIVSANSIVKKIDGIYVIGIKNSKAQLVPVVLKVKTPTQACVEGKLENIKKTVVGDESLLQRIYEGQELVEDRGGN
jgi:RND family efflux transporter MFP subunit